MKNYLLPFLKLSLLAGIAVSTISNTASAEWRSLGALSKYTGAIDIKMCRYRVFLPRSYSTAALPSGYYFELPQTNIDSYSEKNAVGVPYAVKQFSLISDWKSLKFGDAYFNAAIWDDYYLLDQSAPEAKVRLEQTFSRSKSTRIAVNFLRVFKSVASMTADHVDGNSVYVAGDGSDDTIQLSANYLRGDRITLEADCGAATPNPTPSPVK